MTVKTIFGTLLTACVFTAVYVVLTERLAADTIVVGFIISLVALLVTQRLLGAAYSTAFTLGGAYIAYVFYLFYIILKSAVVSLGYIFSKNVGVNLIRYQTALKSDNLKSMLANAITLTPGTVTADMKGDVIEVMKLCVQRETDQTSGFARIERMLSRLDKGETS
jgi:multicomponent Na+:H+ antiporter subunit E